MIFLEMVKVLLILYLVYCISSLILRNFIDEKYDRKLNIQTKGTRSWDTNKLYNRTESTPYLALQDFSKAYKFSKEDHLVDFGCGRGRVAIFLNKKFSIPVTGIELNELTYEELENNVHSSQSESIALKMEKAEEYKIADDENKFFFFNPFSSIIFEKVVKNIVKDAKEKNKEIEIILYYPLASYKKILKDDFELSRKIRVRGSVGYREKFLIYTFNPNVDSTI